MRLSHAPMLQNLTGGCYRESTLRWLVCFGCIPGRICETVPKPSGCGDHHAGRHLENATPLKTIQLRTSIHIRAQACQLCNI